MNFTEAKLLKNLGFTQKEDPERTMCACGGILSYCADFAYAPTKEELEEWAKNKLQINTSLAVA